MVDTSPNSTSDSPSVWRRGRRLWGVLASLTLLVAAFTPNTASAARDRTDDAAIGTVAAAALSSFQEWQGTNRPIDYIAFVQYRDETIELTAQALDIDRAVLQREWADAPAAKAAATLAAISQLGVDYQSRASEPGVGFDCSGLTSYAYETVGIDLPRVSGDQIRAAGEIDRVDAEIGDLVHYPGHIGIYVGAGVYVNSPYSGSTVEIVELPDRSLSFGDVLPAQPG